MHTPRFSGQPISAGDLVLAIIPSRPILTNCENVGTVFPHSRAKFRMLLASARIKAREDTNMKRPTAHPDQQPARNSAGIPEREMLIWLCSERLTRLFGTGVPFRPLFYPIPSFLFWDRRYTLPLHQPMFRLITIRRDAPLTNNRV